MQCPAEEAMTTDNTLQDHLGGDKHCLQVPHS